MVTLNVFCICGTYFSYLHGFLMYSAIVSEKVKTKQRYILFADLPELL